MGYGDRVYLEKVYDIDVGKRYIGDLVRNPLPEDYKSIKIGSYHGKLVKLKVEAQAINRDDEFALFWNLYDILIPNENGRIDVQLLTLPYVKNYGWAIEAMEMELIDDPCNGKHDFGWVDRQSCHVWACRNMKCQARDPVAPESASNGKHASSGWNTEKHQLLCDVCGHVMETDTKAPVLEVLKDGESYTVEDNINGNPGAYTFTVSDPALDGEASSGIKSVTINGEPQAGPTYRLPAPDGGNNDAGAEYTVVATDNAGNETTATVRTYRRHHVKVISPDGKKTYADLMLPHNEYLVLQIRLPAGVSATLTDEADGTKIPYDKEKGEFRVGLITKNRTLVLNYSTKHPKVELRLGTGQYFTGYNADSDEPYYLKGASMDGNSYQIGMWVDTDAKPGYYLSSPNRYTQEELAALDESLWKEYKIAEATPGSIVLPFILITIDAAAYEENGGWYVYAKATNPTGTTFVSTPNIIIDVENPKAIDLSTGKELENYGKYYGNLRFKVEDSSPVTVRCHTSPSGKAELLTPDENGVYTIPAEYDNSIQHTLIIEDACGNVASYRSFKVFWNYLTNVREKDHWDVAPAQPIRISREQNLKEELSKVQIGVFAADTSGFIPVEVSWEIPADYDPQSQREQTFTVNGTVILEGTGARCNSGLDVITRPGEEWKKNISVQVTVEGDPQYKVTVQDCENGRVKVVNAAGTAEDGTPLFFKGELVMLSIDPDEGYMLSTLSVNGNPAAVAVGDDTYTFIQPEGDVTITAAFEMRNEHTVTFDANGGSEPEELPEEVTTAMPAKKILHGSEYSLPECEFIAPENQQFKAWQIDGTEYPVNAPVTVTADITVEALWEDAPPSHEHSYGDWSKDGTSHWHECTDDDCPKKPESIKDKAAHVYTDDADTTCNVCGYERTVTPPAPTEFIVTFDAGDGTPSVGSMTTTNQKLSSLPSASRSKHSFDGWYTEKSGGTKVTTDTVFHAKTTVYAHWTYTGGGYYYPPVTYYTLCFETGGGSDISSVQGTYNAYIDLTQYVPTWRGHTFTGWYSERSLKNKVSGVYLTKDMTVYAGWRVDENPNTGANPFTDVSEKDWFYGDVMFVYENGLMLGTSKTLFSPHGTATRGMMATILWRMEGSPAPKGKNSFTDVEAGKWYADAITWTAENGIFAGYGKDKFGPDDPITREQLAAIFYRYADYKGYDLTVKGNLDKFKDADKITDYAKTAMQWAVGSGLMKGKSGNLLDPQGTATRAEIAAMLHRFIEKYELVQGKAPGGLMGWIDPKRLQIPKTGDSSVLGLWGISLCTSLAGCLALTTWQIRRRREEKSLQSIEK